MIMHALEKYQQISYLSNLSMYAWYIDTAVRDIRSYGKSPVRSETPQLTITVVWSTLSSRAIRPKRWVVGHPTQPLLTEVWYGMFLATVIDATVLLMW